MASGSPSIAGMAIPACRAYALVRWLLTFLFVTAVWVLGRRPSPAHSPNFRSWPTRSTRPNGPAIARLRPAELNRMLVLVGISGAISATRPPAYRIARATIGPNHGLALRTALYCGALFALALISLLAEHRRMPSSISLATGESRAGMTTRRRSAPSRDDGAWRHAGLLAYAGASSSSDGKLGGRRMVAEGHHRAPPDALQEQQQPCRRTSQVVMFAGSASLFRSPTPRSSPKNPVPS